MEGDGNWRKKKIVATLKGGGRMNWRRGYRHDGWGLMNVGIIQFLCTFPLPLPICLCGIYQLRISRGVGSTLWDSYSVLAVVIN